MQGQIRGAACTDDFVIPLSIGSGQLPDEATTLRRRWPGGPAASTSRVSNDTNTVIQCKPIRYDL
jgi:hypothetical protein